MPPKRATRKAAQKTPKQDDELDIVNVTMDEDEEKHEEDVQELSDSSDSLFSEEKPTKKKKAAQRKAPKPKAKPKKKKESKKEPETVAVVPSKRPQRNKAKPKPESEVDESSSSMLSKDDESASEEPIPTKVKRTRSSKNKAPPSDAIELYTPLNVLSNKYLGFHESTEGQLATAVHGAKGRSIALYLGPSRTWNRRIIDDAEINDFKQALIDKHIDPAFILAHSSLLTNYASAEESIRNKSFHALKEEMIVANRAGVKMVNIHPGSTKNIVTLEEGMKNVADVINKVHAVKETGDVMVILENCAHLGKTGTVGRTFEELKGIIDLVKDKTRVGVCLDTCHLYGGGVDIRTAEAFEKRMVEFDTIIGREYLRGMHLNDSKGAFGSGVDRHDIPTKGLMGKAPFEYIMNSPRFDNIPLILETAEQTLDILRTLEKLEKTGS
ncbi:putative Endonuclease 4 like protein [Blattamonas nauphoetae]|uniref:Endonuclease 4 like protein n=1 Tax=Blattamonas nauphoetae TaxID=2049346 RepID=A0ABQ9YIA2_9EUKA|nr:putative Endonuclease 4 like protein [Blattamonas nauphoetae]